MGEYLLKGLLFMISALIDLYVFVLFTRIMFYWARVSYKNQFYQTLLKLTDPLVQPIYKIMVPYSKYDWPTLLLTWLFQLIKILAMALLTRLNLPGLQNALLAATAALLESFANFLFYTILGGVLLSWMPMVHPMLQESLGKLTQTLLAPLRRVLPSGNGVDFSPMIALILIKALEISLLQPLAMYAIRGI